MPRRHISRALREVILDDHDPRRREERLDDEEEEEPVPFLRGRSFGTRVRIGGSSKGMWSERLSVLCAVVLSARSRGIIFRTAPPTMCFHTPPEYIIIHSDTLFLDTESERPSKTRRT